MLCAAFQHLCVGQACVVMFLLHNIITFIFTQKISFGLLCSVVKLPLGCGMSEYSNP